MKRNVIIRADGGLSIGMGHIVRCLALADMLKNDFTIIFAIQQPTDTITKIIRSITESILHLPEETDYDQDALNFSQYVNPSDIVLLDGYKFRTNYQQIIKNKGCKLICIDDLHAWHHLADAIINHAEGVNIKDYSAEAYTKFYLGFDYALLRKEFLTETKKQTKKTDHIKEIFISMGAADENNLTQKFIEALLQVKGIEKIHLMLGVINPNLKSIEKLIENNKHIKIEKHFNISSGELISLIEKCDIAICPASSISIECCAIGIGLISGYTADNQLGILSGLTKYETIKNWGNLNTLTIENIITEFQSLSKKPDLFNQLIRNQKKMIDGKSPERLRSVFKQFVSEKLHFRTATESDVDLYFDWANDPEVRNNSYNQDPVDYNNHVKWFQSKLSSPDCYFYLFFNEDNKPVGQIRIDKSGSEITIGISIDKAFRGKSLGVQMIRSASADYLKIYPQATIFAYIKVENGPSYNSFKKAGFSHEEIIEERNVKSYKLQLN